jgi:hypothetical protein
MDTVARSLGELVAMFERDGRAVIEYRGRLMRADRDGLWVRFQMADGLEGRVVASWPEAPIDGEDGRSALLYALNSLVQRCAMFETCERAYVKNYGRRTA